MRQATCIISVYYNGIARLQGTVFSDEDLTIVDEQVRDLAGVIDVRNELEVAGV